MAFLAPLLKQRFEDDNGNPLSGGQVHTYVANTTTPIATYVDQAALTPNTNPIILDARGECDIYIQSGPAYKFVIQDADGVTIDTIDNVTLADLTDTPIPSGGGAGWVLIKNSGADYDYAFAPPEDFEGPQGEQGEQGEQGPAATIAVGDVATLPAGSSASVTNVGTSGAAVFDFEIPQGEDGVDGVDGSNGVDGASFLTGSGSPSGGLGNDGDSYLDIQTGSVYLKASGTWSQTGTLSLGGSGAGSMTWHSPEGEGPVMEEYAGFKVARFSKGLNQKLISQIRLPASHISGTLYKLRLVCFSENTTDEYAFKLDTFRSRFGDAIDSVAHTHSDTSGNFGTTTPSKAPQSDTLNLTDGSGNVGSSIQADDILRLEFSRVAPSGTEQDNDVYVVYGLMALET